MTDFYTITINGVDLLVDAEDADFMGRYQSAYNKLAANPPASIESDPSSAIRQYCQIYRDFFRTLFGAEISEKVFAGLPDNARVYDSIFETLLQKIMEQRMAAVLRLAEAKKRYAAR